MRDTYETYANRKEQEVEEHIKRELDKQKDFWNDFVKSAILTMFYAPDLHTSFFVHRKNLKKRSNLSFDERIFMKAPNNMELRMPVALKIMEGKVMAQDLYGGIEIMVPDEPPYELVEDKVYILTIKKNFVMSPIRPELEKNVNGLECHLKPTNLPLQAELDEESDYRCIAELPEHIETEEECIDIITRLQNIYRLNDYYVERKDALTIVVEGKEDVFIVCYSPKLQCLKIGIIDQEEN